MGFLDVVWLIEKGVMRLLKKEGLSKNGINQSKICKNKKVEDWLIKLDN